MTYRSTPCRVPFPASKDPPEQSSSQSPLCPATDFKVHRSAWPRAQRHEHNTGNKGSSTRCARLQLGGWSRPFGEPLPSLLRQSHR
jgi:hypothetical protein